MSRLNSGSYDFARADHLARQADADNDQVALGEDPRVGDLQLADRHTNGSPVTAAESPSIATAGAPAVPIHATSKLLDALAAVRFADDMKHEHRLELESLRVQLLCARVRDQVSA